MQKWSTIGVTEIRDVAKLAGIKPSEAWKLWVQPSLSAASKTEPGVMANTSHS
jgi:hypothetical protein